MKLPSLTRLGLFLGVVGLLLAGCGKKETASNPSGVKKLTIAVVPKATTHSYWKSAQAGVERGGPRTRGEPGMAGSTDDSKVADQIGIFNNLAASGIDGIVLAPCDDRALVSHVRTAVRRGLPIAILTLRSRAKPAWTTSISLPPTTNRQGVTAANTLLRLSTSSSFGGRVLMVRFTEGSASTRLREEGFVEKLGSQAKLKLEAQQFTDGSMAGAQRVAETLLGNYVKNNTLELDGIFASNQPTAEGTYNALRALRDKGVIIKAPFVGFDDSELLLQGLQNGIIQALVVQDPDRMGYLGVKSVVDHLQKLTCPVGCGYRRERQTKQ